MALVCGFCLKSGMSPGWSDFFSVTLERHRIGVYNTSISFPFCIFYIFPQVPNLSAMFSAPHPLRKVASWSVRFCWRRCVLRIRKIGGRENPQDPMNIFPMTSGGCPGFSQWNLVVSYETHWNILKSVGFHGLSYETLVLLLWSILKTIEVGGFL